jgi:hypothetical protein
MGAFIGSHLVTLYSNPGNNARLLSISFASTAIGKEIDVSGKYVYHDVVVLNAGVSGCRLRRVRGLTGR